MTWVTDLTYYLNTIFRNCCNLLYLNNGKVCIRLTIAVCFSFQTLTRVADEVNQKVHHICIEH